MLDLSKNKIRKNQVSMKNLSGLKRLHLHVNEFTEFPSGLPTNIEVLILERNKIRSINRRSLGKYFSMDTLSRLLWSQAGRKMTS